MHGIMRQRSTLYFAAGLFSIILSIWAAATTSVINPDAICYLYSAEAMSRGLSIATHLCTQAKWPFYSVLIFGVNQLTHLSLTTSAYLLNGVFSLISVIAFIAIINTLTQNTRIIVLSTVIILLAHEFNGLRVDIIRDHGFWAFYLVSLFFMLQYFLSSPTWRNALCWSASLIFATLFRIEGALFLLLLPLITFADVRLTSSKRMAAFLQLHTLTLIGGLVLLVWIMLHPQQELGRLTEIQFQLTYGLNEFIQAFKHTANALATHVLSPYSTVDAKWIAIGLFAIWYVFSVMSSVSLIYAVLIIYAITQKISGFTRETRLVIWSYILINILITLFFLVDNLFLSGRYLIAISLVLMLWVPFALENLIVQWHRRKWPLLLAVLLIVIYGSGGIFSFGHSKKYIREGGDWLALHASSDAKIYSNDYQLLYYSTHFGDAIFKVGPAFENINTIANGKWHQYDYVALRVSQNELTKNQSILKEINLTPIVIFQNDRGDQVRIYHKKMEN